MGILSTIAPLLDVSETSDAAQNGSITIHTAEYSGCVDSGIGRVSGNCDSADSADARAREAARVLCAIEGGGEPVQPVRCDGGRFATEIRCNASESQPFSRRVLGISHMRPNVEATGRGIIGYVEGSNTIFLQSTSASEQNTAGFTVEMDNGDLDGRTSFGFHVEGYDSRYGRLVVDLYDKDGTRILHAMPVMSSEGEDDFIIDFSQDVSSIFEIRIYLQNQQDAGFTLLFSNLRFEYKTAPRSWFVSELGLSEENLNTLLEHLFRNPTEEYLVLSPNATSREKINNILEQLNSDGVINDQQRQLLADQLLRYYNLLY